MQAVARLLHEVLRSRMAPSPSDQESPKASRKASPKGSPTPKASPEASEARSQWREASPMSPSVGTMAAAAFAAAASSASLESHVEDVEDVVSMQPPSPARQQRLLLPLPSAAERARAMRREAHEVKRRGMCEDLCELQRCQWHAACV